MSPQSQPVIEQREVKVIASSKPVEQKPVDVTPSPVPNNKWINNFVSQTGLLWGNQGSGKSWMARYIAKLKKDKGYRVVVLDPDSNRTEWEGVESYHDFEEIAEFLRWYVEELKGRYKAFNASNMTEDAWRAKLWAEGEAIAVICEEVTTYVDLIEDKELLTQFFRLGLTKSRKQEMPLTFVSHNNNQTALGGIKGLANLIEKMLQLELQTDIDPETLQPVASGKGAVKLDGSNQWVPVTLPKLERKITNFGEVQPTVVQQPDVQLERSVEPLNGNEPDEVERLNALVNKPFSDSEPPEPSTPEPLNLDPFSPEITPQERGSVVSFRRSGRSKEETIFLVWGAKKGGNKAYLAAKEKLDCILSPSGLD
jgi:energy-coupling factor transporter ATP-binding protein EcfA2